VNKYRKSTALPPAIVGGGAVFVLDSDFRMAGKIFSIPY